MDPSRKQKLTELLEKIYTAQLGACDDDRYRLKQLAEAVKSELRTLMVAQRV